MGKLDLRGGKKKQEKKDDPYKEVGMDQPALKEQAPLRGPERKTELEKAIQKFRAADAEEEKIRGACLRPVEEEELEKAWRKWQATIPPSRDTLREILEGLLAARR